MFTLYEHRDLVGHPCYDAEYNRGGGIDVSHLKHDPYAALADVAAWAQVSIACEESACRHTPHRFSPVATDGGGALVQPLLFPACHS